jgi:hypothetical protein
MNPVVKKIFNPKVWLILFGLLHTVGFTMDVMSAINDDDVMSEIIETEIDATLADNQVLIDAFQENMFGAWALGMVWSPILFVGAFWLKGSEQAKLSITFGAALAGIGVLFGYGFSIGDMMAPLIFGAPMILSGVLHLNEDEPAEAPAAEA